MLGIDRHAARVTWTVFLIALVIYLAFLARETLMIFALAVFFAYMLSPVLDSLERYAPKRVSRNVSLAIVYCLLVGVLLEAGFLIGSSVAEQAGSLFAKLPQLIKERPDPLAGLPLDWLGPFRGRALEFMRGQLSHLDEKVLPLFQKAVTELLARAGSVLTIVLIPILAFFFLKDGREMKRTLVTWTTAGDRSVLLDEILADLHAMLGHYIRALVILSAATFTFYTLFLEFSGGQYSVLLGGLAALLEFIPVVGPLTAAVAILLLQGFTGYAHVAGLLVFILVYRMFQDYVLSPYLMGQGVELHPLLVLFGVLAGEQIAGIPGMFFSVPVLAMLRVVYVRVARSRTLP